MNPWDVSRHSCYIWFSWIKWNELFVMVEVGTFSLQFHLRRDEYLQEGVCSFECLCPLHRFCRKREVTRRIKDAYSEHDCALVCSNCWGRLASGAVQRSLRFPADVPISVLNGVPSGVPSRVSAQIPASSLSYTHPLGHLIRKLLLNRFPALQSSPASPEFLSIDELAIRGF